MYLKDKSAIVMQIMLQILAKIGHRIANHKLAGEGAQVNINQPIIPSTSSSLATFESVRDASVKTAGC